VRALVTVAAISTSTRGLAAEVQFDHVQQVSTSSPSSTVTRLHTLAQTMLTTRWAEVERIDVGAGLRGDPLRARVLTNDGL